MRRKMSEAGRLMTYRGHGHVRKADCHSKKARIPELFQSSGIRGFICCRCYAPYDHDQYNFSSVLQVLFEACKRESNLTFRKTRGYNESA